MDASVFLSALLLAALAGSTIPLGAALALWDRIHPHWLSSESRHGVIAFGGGVLVAAIALVLVPEGLERAPKFLALPAFMLGGLAFFLIDRALGRRGHSAGQLLAMLVDYLPEAIALGALLATGGEAGLLLALLIALQNLPESFNAYREVASRGRGAEARTFAVFLGLPLLGPLAAALGAGLLSQNPETLGVLMLFAAGGVLFLTFQDVAPQVKLENSWAPPLGAVAGFGVGLAGAVWLPG